MSDFSVCDYVCTGTTPVEMFGMNFGGWQNLVALALFASALILILFYMVATILRNDKAIAWIKLEAFEFFGTVVIAVFIMALVGFLCAFNAGWIFSSAELTQLSSEVDLDEPLSENTHIYALSQAYLKGVGEKIVNFMTLDMFGASFADAFTATKFIAKPIGQGFEGSPLSGIGSPIKLILNNAMVAMLIAYSINEAQFMILKYSLLAFPRWFLPLGILFRAFLPTRRFGGSLIALSISMLIIYPILFSISLLVTSSGLISLGNTLSSTFDFTVNDLYKQTTYGFAQDFTVSSLEDIPLGAVKLFEIFGNMFASFIGGTFGLLYFSTLFIVGWVAFVGFLLPGINSIILIHTMNSLGRTLGEHIDITSLTRVI